MALGQQSWLPGDWAFYFSKADPSVPYWLVLRKPITDRESISHEEVAYIVDSTASPIASQLAFNAWPGYIQSFIYVAGVSFLATEVDRISFFFRSVPFVLCNLCGVIYLSSFH